MPFDILIVVLMFERKQNLSWFDVLNWSSFSLMMNYMKKKEELICSIFGGIIMNVMWVRRGGLQFRSSYSSLGTEIGFLLL